MNSLCQPIIEGFEGDYAKEIKKDRLTVYYTDNGINKSFSCDLDDHIVVKEP